MPNHITNRLTVTSGSPERLAAFWDAIRGEPDDDGSQNYISFQKIIPMPESLQIESGSRTDWGLEIYRNTLAEREIPDDLQIRLDADPSLLELGEQAYANYLNYGTYTWYDWSIENWGTKWDAYQQEQTGDNTIEFLTAWSGVPDLIQMLSGMFSDIHMEYMYADEDWGNNVGSFDFEGGECVYEADATNSTETAESIATELLGPQWWDEEEADDEDDEEDDEWDDEQ